MGYNIEVSFDILKNSSNASELQKTVKNYAEECGCESFYEDYEYEIHSQFKRNHCILTITFSQTNVEYLLLFLKFIKRREGLFLELIYDDISSSILYASQYYVTQKMNKSHSKIFKQERRERSYSDDENMILNIIKKHKN
jgi:hypothetical protein